MGEGNIWGRVTFGGGVTFGEENIWGGRDLMKGKH